MLWAVAVAAAAVVVGSLVITLAGDQLDMRGLRAFLTAWIVVPYAISGMVAWWRRPASRLGPLMLATALVMALTSMQWSARPVVQSVGHLLDMAPVALFLHVFLAFPTGHLEHRSERVLVAACYVAVLGPQLAKIVLGVNPDSVFTVVEWPGVANLIETVQLLVVAVLLLSGAVLLYVRRQRSGRWVRRPATLVADAFSLALVMLATLFVADIAGWAAADAIRNITFASIGLAPVAFLFALLDARLARGDVAQLVIELRQDPTADLQAPLARALRDPSLRLAYWLPEFGSWADQSGQAAPQPSPDGRHAVRVISREAEPMAALTFNRSLEDEPEILDAVVATAAIAMENGRLRAELRARLQELRGSRVRVLEAGRRERQRLERDLHDGAQQRLVALSLELGLLSDGAGTDSELRNRLATARGEIAASLEELRDIARGIYPAVLAGHGLPVALESVAARAGTPVQLHVELTGRLSEPVEVAAYYLISEALTNIDKHAQARTAVVRVRRDESVLVIDVTDDGVGGADPAAGSGLQGLTDRVEALGGRISMTSPIGCGTELRGEIPCL